MVVRGLGMGLGEPPGCGIGFVDEAEARLSEEMEVVGVGERMEEERDDVG